MSDFLWHSFGVTVRGPLHRRRGIVNQDCFATRQYRWGSVVTVSDGLGSRLHSAHGSRAACQSVCEAAKAFRAVEKLDLDPIKIVEFLHEIWLAKISPLSANDCSTTCLFAIRFGGEIVLAQLGDGLISLYQAESNTSIILTESKEDSFANMTDCLYERFRQGQWQVKKVSVDDWDAIVLCTDGISNDLIPDKISDFTRELYLNYNTDVCVRKRCNSIRKWLIDWPVKGHCDDKTIACLFKKEVIV